MKANPTRALAVAAGLVIIALTAAAFWLSYAHLAEVALAHGMRGKDVRAWAWPATLDLFIVAGELLMLRAALAGKVDGWAIGLTVVGSGSSIGLNVAGVGSAAEVLDYVVAAVPPTAALLAFGALMRQVHQALSERAEASDGDTPASVVEVEVERLEVPTVTPHEVSAIETAAVPPALPAEEAPPLVICGDRRVWHPELPSRDEDDEVTAAAEDRLPTAAAANVIRAAWVLGTSVTETARQATRSTSYVKKVFARLDEERQEADVEFLAKTRSPSIALVPAAKP
ncbi:DUF2637 domain-containing protein [Streptomyces hayashii]|uniref:DUF2637 domain-containing protein n=1 Tax=Streptomyces hayashii TaxID=2839966 RepID=UPI00403C0BA8